LGLKTTLYQITQIRLVYQKSFETKDVQLVQFLIWFDFYGSSLVQAGNVLSEFRLISLK